MKARRSFVRAILPLAILVAAISAAYGSQVAIIEDSNKDVSLSEKAPLEIKSTSFDSKAVKIETDELRQEKSMIAEISEEEKNEIISTNKEAEKKSTIVKNKVKTQKKPYATYSVKKKVVTKSVKTYTTKISNKNTSSVTSKKISREEKIAAEQRRAEQLLNAYISKYPILKGVRIYVRDCPNNWQGCAYYTKGIILIDPDHTAPLEKIVAHEIKHIIDWREDNDIDYNDYHE
ncbi:MAG: hypothetical protein N2440_06760 [Actinobacteria bacterium]|nr:hypothetical protein [Actinomycetota bacterium]